MRRIPATLCILLAIVPLSSGVAATLPVASVANADELHAAMADVGAGDRRVIRLTGDHYEIAQNSADGCSLGTPALPPVLGRVTLGGGGAVIAGGGDTFLPFCVEPEGTLILRNLTIRDFGTTITLQPSASPQTVVAANAGLLRLENVAVRNNGSMEREGAMDVPLIRRVLFNVSDMEIIRSVIADNAGISDSSGDGGIIQSHSDDRLLIHDSSLTDNNVERTFDDPRFDSERGAAFSFSGPTELRNVTVSGNSHGISSLSAALIQHTTIMRNGYGIQNNSSFTSIRNSVIALNEDVDCVLDPMTPVISRTNAFKFEGVNLDSDGSCGMDPATDLVDMDPGLQPLRVLDHDLPGHEPDPSSPIVDRADPEYCLFRDALGRIRNTAADDDQRCALGAIEPPNQPPDFEIDPRLTGTWYDPGHDGHYLSVEVLPDNRVVAMWWTYDPDGNPLWLVGSGFVKRGSVRMPAHQSSGMALPFLDDSLRDTQRWGALDLEFKNCRSLTLRWQADRPGFADGSADLQRLTFNDGLHCR